MKHIGEVARLLRKQAGLTLVEVASSIQAATGETYDNGNLSKFERGILGMSPQKIEALASTLGTSVSAIYRQLENDDDGPEQSVPSRIERLLGEIRAASRNGLTDDEENALAEGLKAQLAWLKAIQPDGLHEKTRRLIDSGGADPGALQGLMSTGEVLDQDKSRP